MTSINLAEVKKMVKVPKRGASPFLIPTDVNDNETAIIVKPPYIQDAEKSKFGKERTILTVQLERTGEVYRWGLNTTSNDRLVEKFGEDGDQWDGKKVRIKVESMNVAGVNKSVLYAVPLLQTSIAPADPSD